MKDYMGVADAHGIETFIPFDEKTILMYQIRAQANSQRHAVAFRVSLSDKDVESIISLCKTKSNKIALIALKQATKGIPIKLEVTNRVSWDLIPNDKLDPYW